MMGDMLDLPVLATRLLLVGRYDRFEVLLPSLLAVTAIAGGGTGHLLRLVNGSLFDTICAIHVG